MSEARVNTSGALIATVFVAAAAVVAWRVAALALPRAATPGGSPVLPVLLALAGMTFLVCGLIVFLRVPGKAGLLFAAFCICSALHWGGPLEPAPGRLRTGLILFYLLVSGILAAAFLLRFALEFPTRPRLANRRGLIRLLYAPAALGTVLGAIVLLAPDGGGLRTSAQQGFLVLHALVTNLFSILALVFVASRLAGGWLTARRKRFVGLMLAGMLVAWLPNLIASAAGVGDPDVWNLTVAALPVAFTIAIFGIRTARPAGRAAAPLP